MGSLIFRHSVKVAMKAINPDVLLPEMQKLAKGVELPNLFATVQLNYRGGNNKLPIVGGSFDSDLFVQGRDCFSKFSRVGGEEKIGGGREGAILTLKGILRPRNVSAVDEKKVISYGLGFASSVIQHLNADKFDLKSIKDQSRFTFMDEQKYSESGFQQNRKPLQDQGHEDRETE